MPNIRTAGRSSSQAAPAHRDEVLDQLIADHQRVRKAYHAFQRLDVAEDIAARAAIVHQVLQELTVHAVLEEELLYPAARGALTDESLIDQAEVEHASFKPLIERLRTMPPEDEQTTVLFTVLCEQVLHHVDEEEGEVFPQLELARLDWASLAADMACHREEVTPAEPSDDEDDATTEEPTAVAGRSGTKAARALDRAAARHIHSLD